MKKITFVALHLGYGGIEKCISKVSNMLKDEYEIEIISIYKIYDIPKFCIDEKVKVKYLIDTDLPQKLNKYKVMISKFKFKEIIINIWNEYLKKFKIFPMIYDFIYGTYILGIKRNSELKKYLNNSKSDIYISTHMFMNKTLNKYATGNIISWEHNHHNNNIKYIKSIRKACKYVEKMIVVSKDLEQFYKKDFKQNNIKCEIEYIPNFIKCNVDNKFYDNTLKENRLISIGRLSQEKGFLDLIDIMEELVKKDNTIKLDLVGDGNQHDEILEQIRKKGLQANIIMYGYLSEDNINKLFEKSKIYIMTSYTESFGLVLLEAMNNGIPCIAYESAQGAREIINPKNGILVENRNKELMIEEIIRLLKNDEIIKNFSPGIKETLNLYSEDRNKKIWIGVIEKI